MRKAMSLCFPIVQKYPEVALGMAEAKNRYDFLEMELIEYASTRC